MAGRGSNSNSFLREGDELEFVHLVQGGKTQILNEIMQRDSSGKLIYSKEAIMKQTNVHGINKHLVINTMNLQTKTFEEISDTMGDFANYLEDYGLTGILEFHANDTTQNSFHVHFWCDNDSKEVYDLMRHYVSLNKLSDYEKIDIQGSFTKISDLIDDTMTKKEKANIIEEVKSQSKNVPKAINLIKKDDEDEFEIDPSHGVEDYEDIFDEPVDTVELSPTIKKIKEKALELTNKIKSQSEKLEDRVMKLREFNKNSQNNDFVATEPLPTDIDNLEERIKNLRKKYEEQSLKLPKKR